MSEVTAQKVRSLRAAVGVARTRYEQALKELCPEGATVRYWWGEHYRDAVVVRWAYGDRALLRNVKTGGERWVHAYQFDADFGGGRG